MFENLGLNASTQMIFEILVSFGFVTGILLMVSPDAYKMFNRALTKEYGLKFKFFKKLETEPNNVLDDIMLKNRMVFGTLISCTSFILLLIYH